MLDDGFRKFDLTGKTALVTGGSSGLGYNMARALARSGATVMIAARRDDVLKEAATRLKGESGAEILDQTVDLADRSSVAALAEKTAERMGGVDIFVGNAGQDNFELLDVIEDESIDYMLQMNVSANIELFRSFLPHMRQKKWGRVIFSSSGTSICASPHEGMGTYTATKGALNAFTRTAATETGHDGITVNSLILGVFMTDMLQEIVDGVEAQTPGGGTELINSIASMTAAGRIADVQEVEGLIQLLASDAGSYITGANLAIDGGLTIMLRPNHGSALRPSNAPRAGATRGDHDGPDRG